MASKDKGTSEIQERGSIFFVYRPRIQHETAKELDDVERFYMVLKPDGAQHFRMIVLGRKRLPEIGGHERIWGFMEQVANSGAEVEKALRHDTYQTKTRGERQLPAGRPAGEGVYALVRRKSSMHLVFSLELPEKPGPVQKALNIAPEASYVLSVKNPEKGSPASAGLRERDQAKYPEELQEEFRNRRFADEDPRLLDYAGAEIVLVGARTEPQKAYDLDLGAEDESLNTAEIIKQLRMVQSRHPVKPLLEGAWE